MNYYRRYVGDYLRDTSRLSVLEHGAYNLLLDHYYAEETPIPLDIAEVYTMVRAMSPVDRKAVDKVLDRYFTKEADGYHNARADHEIEVSRKARDNGKGGGRPKTGTITGNETGIETESQTGTITGEGGGSGHPPTTNHQPPSATRHPSTTRQSSSERDLTTPASKTPSATPGKSSAPPDSQGKVEITPQAKIAIALRAAGVTITSSHPRAVQWAEQGITPERLLEAVAIARMRKPEGNIAVAYLVPIAEEMLSGKGTTSTSATPPANPNAGTIKCETCGDRVRSFTGRQCNPCWRGDKKPVDKLPTEQAASP